MNIRKIIYKVKNIIGAILDMPIGFHKEEYRLWDTYYNENLDFNKKNAKNKLIVMIDGRTIHNGLSDRFKGICSAYRFALNNDLIFKLNYRYPFDISEFLIPNKYDWTIQDNEILYDKKISRPVLLNDYQIETYAHRSSYLKKYIKSYKQVHLYTNALFGDQHFAEDFSTLFKPTQKLQEEIDRNLSRVGENYITISIRFQRLLGDDFSERNAKTLSEVEANKLKEDVVEQIEIIHSKEKNKKIIVFSDSNIFLDYILKKLDYIHIVPGIVVHVDNTSDADTSAYMKTFVDFFLISKASKIYLLYSDLLYKSGFPKRASEINNIPFEAIKF